MKIRGLANLLGHRRVNGSILAKALDGASEEKSEEGGEKSQRVRPNADGRRLSVDFNWPCRGI